MLHFRNAHENKTQARLQQTDDYLQQELPETDGDVSAFLDVKMEVMDDYEISIFKDRNKPRNQPVIAPPLNAAEDEFNSLDDNTLAHNSPSSTESEPEDLPNKASTEIKILNEKKYSCKFCQKSYGNPRTLKIHINAKHIGPKNYKCTQCDAEFIKEQDCQQHKRKFHTGFVCAICGKVYKTQETLRDHAEAHMTDKSFVCQVENCGKAFVSKKRLARHRLCHSGEAKYVCEECGFRTKRRASLKLHLHIHTGAKPYECPICHKRFSLVSSRNDHVPIHSNERPYVCDICGATFTRPKALYHHKPIHSAVKQFVCKICGKAYAQAAGLSSHLRTHRKAVNEVAERK